MKGFKILIFALRGDRRVLLIVGILSITMIGLIGSTFLVLHSESQVEAGIDGILRTADDTMWWSLSTVLTGGCEVFDPVTPGGRFGAIILKILAVTVLAAMMGLTCGWLTKILASEQSEQNSGQPTQDQQDGEQSELQQEGEQSDQGQQQESDEQKSEQVPKDGELESTDEDMNKGKDSPSEVKEEGEER